MHASVTGALAGIPAAMASALGVPDTFFDARDEILRGAAAGKFYAVAMSERGVGSRLSQLSTMYSVENGGGRLQKSQNPPPPPRPPAPPPPPPPPPPAPRR